MLKEKNPDSDVAKAVQEVFVTAITTTRTDIDLSNHVKQYQQAIKQGSKVIVVAHSQGNFYANLAYPELSKEELGSFGIVAVATPASYVKVPGNSEPYTTLYNDLVIDLIVRHGFAIGGAITGAVDGAVDGAVASGVDGAVGGAIVSGATSAGFGAAIDSSAPVLPANTFNQQDVAIVFGVALLSMINQPLGRIFARDAVVGYWKNQLGHAFVGAYLKGDTSGPNIIGDISNVASTLTTPKQAEGSNGILMQEAGNDTAFAQSIDLGKTKGTFQFDYNTKSVKDQVVIRYEGKVIFDSQCVGTGGKKAETVSYEGRDTGISVEVRPNCAGESGTAWDFAIHCPTDEQQPSTQ